MYIQPISQVVCRVWEDPETVHLYVPCWFETFSDQELSVHHRKWFIFEKQIVSMESILHQVHQSGRDRSQDSVRAPRSIASQWCSRQSKSWDKLSSHEHFIILKLYSNTQQCDGSPCCSPCTSLYPRSAKRHFKKVVVKDEEQVKKWSSVHVSLMGPGALILHWLDLSARHSKNIYI